MNPSLVNESVERTILGVILLDNSAYDDAAEMLEDSDFGLDSHRRIFARLGQMIREGQAADTATLVERLQKNGELQTVGGATYILRLIEGTPRLNVANYAGIVKEKSLLRRLRGIGDRLISGAENPGAEPENLIGEVESQCLELRGASPSHESINNSIVPLLDRLNAERNRNRELLGLPTGVYCFDEVTRGLQNGELTLIGSKSGDGKSAFMVQVAIENCKAGTPVLIFSLEMTKEQILRRIFSAVSGVPFPRVRDLRWATDEDMAAIRDAAQNVADWPLYVLDASGIAIEKLVATARLAIRRKSVRLVCCDYIQIVNASGKDERLRVSAVSRGLTRLAKDEQVPVLALSQLSRAEKLNANRRPTKADLRESSQLENDAHVIALIHRPWDEEEGRASSDAELIIAKQRSGECGIFPLTFDRRTLSFKSRQTRPAPKRVATIR